MWCQIFKHIFLLRVRCYFLHGQDLSINKGWGA